jgi:hypothetical protein
MLRQVSSASSCRDRYNVGRVPKLDSFLKPIEIFDLNPTILALGIPNSLKGINSFQKTDCGPASVFPRMARCFAKREGSVSRGQLYVPVRNRLISNFPAGSSS